MYLLYIDDSGQSDPRKDTDIPYSKKSGNSRYLTLSGYLTDSISITTDEQLLMNIKKTCLVYRNNELKFSNDKKKTRLKCHDKVCNPEGKVITKCHRDVIFNNLKNLHRKLFSVTVDKEQYEKDISNLEEKEFYAVALNKLLQMVLRFLLHSDDVRPVSIFVDNKDKHNQILVDIYETIISNATYSNYKNKGVFLATVNVCVSTYTPGIQIADLVAGAVWRAYEDDEQDYSTLIKDKFPNFKGKSDNVSTCLITSRE